MNGQAKGKSSVQELGRVLLIVGLGRAGTTSLGLLSTILMVRGLTAAEFATYSVAFGFVALLSLLALFGSETTITRDSASALVLGDKKTARAAASSDIFSTAIFSLTIALMGVFVIPRLPIMPNIPTDLMGICGFWVVAVSMNRVTGEWLRGSRRIVAATLLNGLGPFGGLFNSLAILLLLLILGETGQMNLRNVMIASASVYFIAFLIAFGIGGTTVGIASIRAGFDHWVSNIRLSAYIYITQILQFVSSQQTYILLAGFMFDVHVVALLAVALRLYAMASAVLVTVNQASSELIVRLHTENNIGDLERLVRLASSSAVVIACAIALVLASFRPEGFGIIFGQEYMAAYGISMVFMAASIVNAFGGLGTKALALLGQARAAFATQLSMALIVVILAVPLGLVFGVYGFAMGCVVAGVVQRFVAGALALKQLGIRCYAYVHPRDYLSVAGSLYSRLKR